MLVGGVLAPPPQSAALQYADAAEVHELQGQQHRGQSCEVVHPAEHRGSRDEKPRPQEYLSQVVGVPDYAPQPRLNPTVGIGGIRSESKLLIISHSLNHHANQPDGPARVVTQGERAVFTA